MNMKKKNNPENGFTLLESIIIIIVIAVVLLVIFGFFLKKKEPGQKPPPKFRYKCMTSESGLIPLKVHTTNPNKAALYKNSDLNSASGNKSDFFQPFFVFEKKNDFYRIGPDPFSRKTIGWLHKSDVIEWSHRQALRLNVTANSPPVKIWKKKEDIGKEKCDYEQRTDIAINTSYPILDWDGNHYKIALTWQSGSMDNRGAATGWTSEIRVPQQAEITCYITRNELKKRLEKLLAAIKDIKNKPRSDYPILQFLKLNLDSTFGRGLDLEDKSIETLKKMAGEAPKVPGVFKKHPTEIKMEIEKMLETFERLKEFYEQSKIQGGGLWVPFDLIPGN